jgi:hypothetical protein
MREITPFPELNGVLASLLEGIQGILGADLIGVYLQGSFAIGDADEHSDCDFVVAMQHELASDQVQALNGLHARIHGSGPEWGKHLEGSYFTLNELRDAPGTEVWYVDHGSKSLERSNHCNTFVVRSTLLRRGIVLNGADPTHLMHPVSPDDLRREMLSTLRTVCRLVLEESEFYSNRFYQGYTVLSLCRIMRDIEAGEVGSKREGADGAKRNVPERWHGLIDRAWSTRIDPATSSRTPAEPDDFAETLAFVRYARERTQG